MTNGIKYIGALHGLSILMLVILNIESLSLSTYANHPSVLHMVCEAIMLPLFFFISGCRTRLLSVKQLSVQCVQLLASTLILGIIYTVVTNVGLGFFLHDSDKCGYWLTIVLCEMLLLLHLTKFEVFSRNVGIVLIVLSCILFTMGGLLNSFAALKNIGDVCCLYQLSTYFHYFAIGYILSKCNTIFERLLNSEFVFLAAICIFCFLLYVKWGFATSISQWVIHSLIDPLLGYSSVLILIKFFRSKQESMSSDDIVKVLHNLGIHSYDIYLLHFFFLPKLPYLGIYLIQYPNIMVEMFSMLILSSLIIGCSLLLSWILRSNKILASILLGDQLYNLSK